MVAALLEGILQERWPPWKACLYNLEMISPWGCNFWMDGLAYDKMLTRSITVKICSLDRWTWHITSIDQKILLSGCSKHEK